MRVMVLLDIFFESDKEVISFCENLFQQNKQIELQWKVNEKWGNQISLETLPLNEFNFQSIAKAMVHVYLTFRLGSMINEIIKGKFYFTDHHEIEHIHEITEWIVTGQDLDCKMVRKNKHPVQLLKAIFLMHLRNTKTVNFDSIAQFGMKVFKQDLVDYVGLAIDEFKREEEHQSFINSLREYVLKKESIMPLVHVLEGSPFHYYDERGKLLTKNELQHCMSRQPLYLIGLPQDEWNLAPLVAMAPEEIMMYVQDASDPKIQTVINVFQERVSIKGYHDFPFPMLKSKHASLGKHKEN